MVEFIGENVAGICEKLTENDPKFTYLAIRAASGRKASSKEEFDNSWRDIAEAMKQNHTLEELCINGYNDEYADPLRAPAAMFLSVALLVHPTLKKLTFPGTDLREFRPIALAIQENPRISHLHLVHSFICPDLMDGIESLLRENAIETLEIEIRGAEVFEEFPLHFSFAGNQSLKQLSIQHDDFQHDGMVAISSSFMLSIADLVERNPNLEKLELQLLPDEVTPYTLTLLANAAKKHNSLQEFCFTVCGESHQYGGKAIGDMLATATELSKLAIHGCSSIGETGGLLQPMCRGIRAKTCTLKELVLAGNLNDDIRIDDKGAILLSKALCKRNTIERVCLDHNRIGNAGASSLAKAVIKNNTIIELELRDNGIGPDGAMAIAAVLAANCSLQRLDLSWNPILESGSCALANALATNTNLLNLDAPQVGPQGMECFIRNLPLMSLKALRFDDDSSTLPNALASDLLAAIEENTSLEEIHVNSFQPFSPGFYDAMDTLDQVDRVLKLNKAGRRILSCDTKHVPSSLWPRILAKSSNDADTLYYFLRENPTLFMNPQRRRRRRRRNQALGKRKRNNDND